MPKSTILPNVRSGNETKGFTFLDESLNLQTPLPKSSCSSVKCYQLKETATDSFSFSCTHENTLVNNLRVLPLYVKMLCCYSYYLKDNKLRESLLHSGILIVVTLKPLKISCHCRDVCVILTRRHTFIHSVNLVRNVCAARKGRKE